MMALKVVLILSRPRSGRVEGRTAGIQPVRDWITASHVGIHCGHGTGRRRYGQAEPVPIPALRIGVPGTNWHLR